MSDDHHRLSDVDPGWYPDPEVEGHVRWWTGRRWWGEPKPSSRAAEWPARVTRPHRGGAEATKGWLLVLVLASGLLLLFWWLDMFFR